MINIPYRREYDEKGILIKHHGISNPYPNRRQRKPRARRSSKYPSVPGTWLQVIDMWVDINGKPIPRKGGIPLDAQYKFRIITHEVTSTGEFPIYEKMAEVAISHGNKGIETRTPHYQYKKVRRPVPRGARKWPQYGNVVAINERNAIRKHNAIISQHPQI